MGGKSNGAPWLHSGTLKQFQAMSAQFTCDACDAYLIDKGWCCEKDNIHTNYFRVSRILGSLAPRAIFKILESEFLSHQFVNCAKYGMTRVFDV